MKAGLRSVSIMHGVLCVMTPGIMAMRLWCVISWGIPQKVSNTKIYLFRSYCTVCLQMIAIITVLLIHIIELEKKNILPFFSIKISTLNKCYTLSELYIVFCSFARGPSGSVVRVSDYSIQKILGSNPSWILEFLPWIYFSLSQCTAPSDITLIAQMMMVTMCIQKEYSTFFTLYGLHFWHYRQFSVWIVSH